MATKKAAGTVTGRTTSKKPNFEEKPKLAPDMAKAKDLLTQLAIRAADIEEILKGLAPLLRPERPASELAHLYGVVRDAGDIMATVMTPVGEAHKKLATEIVPQAFERENLTSFTTADGYRVTVSQKYYASVLDKEEAYKWLRNNGLGDLIQETVNAGTLSAAGKKMIEELGKELPEEFFRTFYQPNTSLTRTK